MDHLLGTPLLQTKTNIIFHGNLTGFFLMFLADGNHAMLLRIDNINMKNHPRYTCSLEGGTEEGTYEQRREQWRKQQRLLSHTKLPFGGVHIEEFYEQMVHKDHGGGRTETGSTKKSGREDEVFQRFQNNIWAKGKSFEPITSPEEFQWALNSGTQFSAEEYIIPIRLNDKVIELYKRAHGLVISDMEYGTDQLEEYANTTAYWFHKYIQVTYEYCIQEQYYHEEIIPVFKSILSGKDLVEDWRGRKPNWFYMYSGYYLALVEACQRGDVENMGLSWA
jgi:hypothetical protein